GCAAIGDGGIGAVGIGQKNWVLMMLSLDLPSSIDATVGEEEGLPLPWPEKKVVPSISWDSSDLKELATTVVLTGFDWSIAAAEEDDRTAAMRDEDDGAPF
ncbi:hypothetical protein ACLOJK_018050, partial [Asimina triloba]